MITESGTKTLNRMKRAEFAKIAVYLNSKKHEPQDTVAWSEEIREKLKIDLAPENVRSVFGDAQRPQLVANRRRPNLTGTSSPKYYFLATCILKLQAAMTSAGIDDVFTNEEIRKLDDIARRRAFNDAS